MKIQLSAFAAERLRFTRAARIEWEGIRADAAAKIRPILLDAKRRRVQALVGPFAGPLVQA